MDPLDELSAATNDDEDGPNEDDAPAKGWQARKTFFLNGKAHTFENPVALVLSAARQLGMAIGRDATLLWIADEALLDEYDEKEAEALTTVPENPLNDEVMSYYADVFAQRSKVLWMPSNAAPGAPAHALAASPEAAAPSAAPAAAPAETAPAMERPSGRKRSKTKQESRKDAKRDRRRRSLALREARLSNITERYTEEMAVMSEDSAERPSPASNPHSPKPAVWPGSLSSMRVSSLKGLGSLPRIDSASMALDQLDQEQAPDTTPTPSALPPARLPPPQAPSPTDPPVDGLRFEDLGLDMAAPQRRDVAAETEPEKATGVHAHVREDEEDPPVDEVKGEANDNETPCYPLGARVEVDFDDEGWFAGVVDSVSQQTSRQRGGRLWVYSVKLDDGEMAEDVEGSEIRLERMEDERASSGGGSADSIGRPANTRSDTLSAFEIGSEAGSDHGSDGADTQQVRARVVDGSVEWSFLDDFNWSPPYESLLRAHDEHKFPRWREVGALGMGKATQLAQSPVGSTAGVKVPDGTL